MCAHYGMEVPIAPQDLQIRRALPSDIYTLQGIARRVIVANYVAFLGQDNTAGYIDSGQADKEVEDGIGSCWVMLQGEAPIGYVVLYGDLLHLLMIDVPYQRKGYGARLLDYAEEEMFNAYSVIKLQTFEKNTAAVQFYEKNGWVAAGVENVEGLGLSMLHMEKSRASTLQQ